MDYIVLIQDSLDYMETHLLEPITYEDVADRQYVSRHYMHTVFSMITGVTITEYLRNRRLSLAGEELISSDVTLPPLEC